MARQTKNLSRNTCIEAAASCLVLAENRPLDMARELDYRAMAWVKLGELIGDDDFTMTYDAPRR